MFGNDLHRISVGLVVVLTAAVVAGCAGAGPNASSAPSPSAGNVVPVFGLDYGPYTAGDAPPAQVPDARIEAMLKKLQGRALWIKPPGVGGGISHVAQIAHRLGFKVFATAYLTTDPKLVASQIRQLEVDVDNGWVDMAAVGNEAVWQKFLTVPQLAADLDGVRSYLRGRVPLTTIEPDVLWMRSPELARHVDVVTANITPFSLEVPYQDAMAYVIKSYADVGNITHKEVWIGETEWATDGGYHGKALANPQNAANYFAEVQQWAHKNQVKMFYFEAFDEPWLGKVEPPHGYHWGIFTSDGTLKAGMDRGFRAS